MPIFGATYRFKRNKKTGKSMGPGKLVRLPGARVKPARRGNALVRLIKQVATGISETKTAMWYNTADTPGTPGVPGSYAASGWNYKDQTIVSNTTDIKRLIPNVFQGTSDNQRIGERISPKSLVVKGAVAVNVQVQPNKPNNLYVVMYCLQHVSFKSYAGLQTGNDFTQLLNTGENSTTAFLGKQIQKDLPVDKGYYRLLKKKVIPLRYAGLTSFAETPTNTVASMANSHRYHANFTINLSKKLPKVFKYPENNAPNPNDPMNSSIFLCAGYYSMDESLNTIIPVDGSTAFALTYVSRLDYKDL